MNSNNYKNSKIVLGLRESKGKEKKATCVAVFPRLVIAEIERKRKLTENCLDTSFSCFSLL